MVEFVLPCDPSVAAFNLETMQWCLDHRVTYVYEDGLRGVRPAGPPDTVADDTVWYLLNPGIHIVYGKS